MAALDWLGSRGFRPGFLLLGLTGPPLFKGGPGRVHASDTPLTGYLGRSAPPWLWLWHPLLTPPPPPAGPRLLTRHNYSLALCPQQFAFQTILF